MIGSAFECIPERTFYNGIHAAFFMGVPQATHGQFFSQTQILKYEIIYLI